MSITYKLTPEESLGISTKPKASVVTVRIPLWQAIDALHELDGDEYCLFRDAIIAAIEVEIADFEELATK